MTVTPKPSATATPKPTAVATPKPTPSATPKPTEPTAPAPEIVPGTALKGRVVVLDPGHQTKSDSGLEPIAPGSETLKPRTANGARGVVTRRYEYEINLEIALKVKARLEAQGCVVHMTRTKNDVQISNIERAQFAVSF